MTFVERECGQVVDRRIDVHHFALRPPQAAFGGIEKSGADPVATGVRTYVNGDEVARPPARPPSLCGDQKTKNAGLRVRTGWIAGNFGTGFCDQGERSRALDEHLQFETGVGNAGRKAGLIDPPEAWKILRPVLPDCELHNSF